VVRALHFRLAMKVSIVMALSLVAATASADRPDKAAPRTLEPDQVQERMTALSDDVRACYLGTVGELRGAGRLDITLSIHRTGLIDRIEVRAPGLPSKLAKKVDECVRPLVAPLTFPAARTSTVVTVPYFYQRTAAANAGPQLSCWNPKGCPGR
jgi:hypothetical protein